MPVKEFIKAKEKISEFTNKESVEFLSNFFIYFEEELNNISSDRIRECLRNKFGNFILELNVNFSKEEVNKLWFVQMFENMKNSKYPDYASRTWKIVFIYFLKENFYNDKQLDFFVKKMDYVVDILNVHETIIPILTSDNSPYFFDYIKLKSRISNNLGVSLLKYDFNDEFLKNLLYRFIEEHFEKYISTNTQPFFNEFGKSLNMKLPNSIYEFNINTLRSQAEYFKEYHRETLTTLKYFYIKLTRKHPYNNFKGWNRYKLFI